MVGGEVRLRRGCPGRDVLPRSKNPFLSHTN